MAKLPTVFIDRDGTINVEAGYINTYDNFVMFDFVPQAIRLLNIHNIQAVVVTNQAGVGRGYFDEDHVRFMLDSMRDELSSKGAELDGIYYCPHHKSSKEAKYAVDCNCRKPKTGMAEMAFEELEIDESNMFMIGDKNGDMKFGRAIGATTIMVMTGYGKGEYEAESETWDHQPDYVVENLLEAVYIVLGKLGHKI